MEIGCYCFIFYTSKQLRPRRLFSNQALYTTHNGVDLAEKFEDLFLKGKTRCSVTTVLTAEFNSLFGLHSASGGYRLILIW